MTKTTLIMICGDRCMDDFLHAADVFEPFKRHMFPDLKSIPINTDKTLTEAIASLRKQFDESPDVYALAIFSKDSPEGAWFDPTVKVASTGQQWIMFKDMLEHVGYPS